MDFSSKHFFKAARVPVVAVRELRQGGTGSTVHVEFDLAGAGLSYGTADNLSVCPVNEDEVVQRVASACGFDLGDTREFTLVRRDGDASKTQHLFPTPCTMRQALARYCDLTGTVRKSALPKLAAYARDPTERDRLLHLSSSSGRTEFHDWVTQPRRTVCEVLEKFSSVEIPFGDFVQIVPRLQSRDYTISSSSLRQPGICSVTCKVVAEAKDPDGAECTVVFAPFLPA